MIKCDKLLRKIRNADNVFVMGHKNLDIDAFVSSLAVAELCKKNKKQCYIIVEDTRYEETITNCFEYIKNNSYKIGTYESFIKHKKKNSLLILVDTFNGKRSQNYQAFLAFEQPIIIDHHLFGKPVDDNYFINANTSSVCEILAGIFKTKRLPLPKTLATLLYAGIHIDSNSFTLKVSEKTFDIASYLVKCGAVITDINVFNKINIKDYIRIQKEIFSTEFYKKKYAFLICSDEYSYQREELAKMADTLLFFDGIAVSFVIGKVAKDLYGVSARSEKYDVAKIMKKINGGGHKNIAAAEITPEQIKDCVKLIKGELQ